MSDAWQVFLDGLDPARLERERFPTPAMARRESFYLDEHRQEMELHEYDKHFGSRRVRASEASAEADADRAIEMWACKQQKRKAA